MKKIFLFLFLTSVFTVSIHAQVTIGSQDAPVAGAILELKSNSQSNSYGFLPPRVALSNPSSPNPLPAHVQGMIVFNTTNAVADSLQAGLYYNTGEKWIRFTTNPSFMESWFYMPSIVFDVSNTGTNKEKDLYQEYTNQFAAPAIKSAGAPAAPTAVLSVLPKATDLYYYITAYDDKVFENISISASGVMTYDVKATGSDSTYINIVFVEK